MQIKINIHIEDLFRMMEIVELYSITNQQEKSKNYLKNITEICDEFPKNEKMLEFRIHALNLLNKPYKSLETTNTLLNLNPYNISALVNIAVHLGRDFNVS